MERRQFGGSHNWTPPNTYSNNPNNQYQPQYFHQYPPNHVTPQNYPPSNNYGINQPMFKPNMQNYSNTVSHFQNYGNIPKHPSNNNFKNIENQNNTFQNSQNIYVQSRPKNQLYSSQIFAIQPTQSRLPKQIVKNNLHNDLQNNPLNKNKSPARTNENKKRQEIQAIRKQLEEVSKKLSVHNLDKGSSDPISQIPKKNYGIAQSMINTTHQQQSYNFYSNIEPKKKAFNTNNPQVNKFLSCLSSKSQQSELESSKNLSKTNQIESSKQNQPNNSQKFSQSNLNIKEKFNSNISTNSNTQNQKITQQYFTLSQSIVKNDEPAEKYIMPCSQNTFPQQPSMNKKMFKKKQNPIVETFSYVDIGENNKQSSTITKSTNPVKFQKSDFMIGKRMGKGQFGEVFLVRHKLTGFICGMKIMQKKQIKSQKYVAQISRELSIQFYLAHRNIAPLYGYFEDQNCVYLLLEFCPDGQLYDKMKKQRRLSEQQTSQIIRQACQGIDYIHKQLIIHRDIKPQNILFSFGQIKICDFGWAVYRGQGMRKTASGSPLYYSPQIVLGNEYDEKIDIWDIGMMAYECILGKVPFRIYSQLDLNRIVTDDIKFPEYVDVTDQAKDFILKTMRKDPEERMQIREMLRHPFLVKYKPQKPPVEIMQDFTKVLN